LRNSQIPFPYRWQKIFTEEVFPALRALIGRFRGHEGALPNGVYDFSLARNTIVLWTIQSCHRAKHLRSGWQALQCVGPKQMTSVYALGGQDYFCLEENVVISVVDGDRASATLVKWLSRASF